MNLNFVSDCQKLRYKKSKPYTIFVCPSKIVIIMHSFSPHIGIHSNLSHTLPRIFMSRPINSFTSRPFFVPFIFCTKNNKTNCTGVRTKCKYKINGLISPALYSNCFEQSKARIGIFYLLIITETRCKFADISLVK